MRRFAALSPGKRARACVAFVALIATGTSAHAFAGVDAADFRPHADDAAGKQSLRKTLAFVLFADASVQALDVTNRVQLLDIATSQVEPLTDESAPFAMAFKQYLDDKSITRNDLDEFLEELENAKERDVAAAAAAPFLIPAFEFSDTDKNILSQLRPGMSLGVPTDIGGGFWLRGTLKLAAPVDADSTDDFAEVLVSPGTFNLTVALDWKIFPFAKQRASFRFLPFAMLKLRPGLPDSTSDGKDVVLVQHGLGLAGAFQFRDVFLLSVHHVWGWHNLTSASERHYYERFGGRGITDVRYWNVGVQINTGKVGDQQTSFYAEWRSLIDEDGFAGFGDTRTLSIGFRNKIAFEL